MVRALIWKDHELGILRLWSTLVKLCYRSVMRSCQDVLDAPMCFDLEYALVPALS